MTDEIEDGAGDIDPTISDEVLRLYTQATTAKSRDERTKALLELAKVFANEHDLTDFTATDDWHAYIEEYYQAKLTYRQAALRLGRLAVNTLDVHFKENDVSDEQIAERSHQVLN